MSTILFPAPKIEKYEILYDPKSHAVEIPVVPHDVMAAVCILDRILRDIEESGVLDSDELCLVYLNAIGKLKPELLREDEN